jgi:DNA segregation ATPase FtsK/SpoIIIE-like protein
MDFWALLLQSGATGLTAAAVLAALRHALGAGARHRERLRALETARDIECARFSHPMAPHTYSPSITYSPHARYTGENTAATAAPELAPGELPGVVDLADVTHKPTAQSILLGLGPGGQPITVPAKHLMHTGLIGATGAGKSNTGRLLLAQLLACGVRCVIADPHYTELDAESGEDWRAIGRRLHLAPAVKAAQIEDLLKWLADEMTRRYELRNAGQRPGAPLVCYVDELPSIIQNVPGAMDTLGALLREGRKVGLYLVSSSQDLLASTLKTGGEIRENLRTAYYSGGAGDSAVRLLDMPKRDIATYEAQLGRGVVLLRSSATSPAQLVRVPLASNEGIARLLSDDHPTMARNVSQDGTGTVTGQHRDSAPERPYSAEERRIIDLLLSGAGVNDIIREVKGIDPARGGRKVQDARAEIEAVLRSSLQVKAVGQ